MVIKKSIRSKNKVVKKRRNTIKLIQNLLVFFIFCSGILLFLYPFYINALNSFIDQQRLTMVQKEMASEYQQRQEKLATKNKEIEKQGIHAGAVRFDTGGKEVSTEVYKKHVIGTVNIPSIGADLPLFDFTNDSLLQIGATVIQGTSYPTGGNNTHSVIAAHSGLPNRELFSTLNKVKKGDLFILTVLGKKLAYEVERIKVVKPEDTDSLKIEVNRDLVTLLTCTPYMINTDRLLVTGTRVEYTEKIAKKEKTSQKKSMLKESFLLVGTGLLGIFLIILLLRMIHSYLLKRQLMDVSLAILSSDGLPIEGKRFALYNKRGSKPLKRKGLAYELLSDERGYLTFTQLPRGIYCLKEHSLTNQTKMVLVGIRKLSMNQPKIMKDYSDETLVIQIRKEIE